MRILALSSLLSFVFLLSIQTPQCTANLVVQTNNDSIYILQSIQVIYKVNFSSTILTNRNVGNPSLPITSNITATATSNASIVLDSILVIRSSLPIEQRVAEAERNGVIAVINITPVYYVPGFLTYRMNDKALGSRIRVPMFEVAIDDGKILWPLILNNEVANITIMPDATTRVMKPYLQQHLIEVPNQWEIVLDNPLNYAWVVTLCVFAATNVALCIWKLVLFTHYYKGAKHTIAVYVLAIELISNALRVVASIDAFGATGVYPEWANIAFIEQSFPFALSSFMLFTLYWHEMMTNASVVVHPFITKMRIPFFVIFGAMVLIQVIRTIVRNVTATEVNLSIMTSIIYLIAALALVIFYAITGIKLLKRLYERKKSGRAMSLRKSTVRILTSGGFIFTFVIVAILFVTGYPYRPVPFVVIWWVFIFILDCASLMNILAFQLPKNKSSTSRGSVGSVHATNSSHDDSTRQTMSAPPSTVHVI